MSSMLAMLEKVPASCADAIMVNTDDQFRIYGGSYTGSFAFNISMTKPLGGFSKEPVGIINLSKMIQFLKQIGSDVPEFILKDNKVTMKGIHVASMAIASPSALRSNVNFVLNDKEYSLFNAKVKRADTKEIVTIANPAKTFGNSRKLFNSYYLYTENREVFIEGNSQNDTFKVKISAENDIPLKMQYRDYLLQIFSLVGDEASIYWASNNLPILIEDVINVGAESISLSYIVCPYVMN